MRVHEQIYTSAPRLLHGGGNLGVVAETSGFPQALMPQLSPLRAYTMLPQFDLATPAAHPPRLVFGPAGDAYAVTRTVFAGADHTGRTTPLTHHIVTTAADAGRRFDSAADFVRATVPMLVSAWDGEPRRIDPPREPSHAVAAPPDAAWWSLLPWLADALVRYATAGRVAVVVIDPADAASAPAGVVAAMDLVPPSLQWPLTFATHVVALNDYVRDAALVVTYADTPFLNQCRQRRDGRAPLVYDLTRDRITQAAAPGPWGRWLNPLLAAPGLNAWIGQAVRDFDTLGLSAADVDAYPAVVNLQAKMLVAAHSAARSPTAPPAEDWATIAGELAALRPGERLRAALDAAAVSAIDTLLDPTAAPGRWAALGTIATDRRWPPAAQRRAIEAALAAPPDALAANVRVAVRTAGERAGLVAPPPPELRPAVATTSDAPRPPAAAAPVPSDAAPTAGAHATAGPDAPAPPPESAVRRQQTAGVGPVRLPLYLAAVVAFAAGVSWTFAPRWSPGDAVALIVATACVGLWLVTEGFVRLFVRAPQQFAVARWGRRSVAVLLMMAILVSLWPLLRHLRPKRTTPSAAIWSPLPVLRGRVREGALPDAERRASRSVPSLTLPRSTGRGDQRPLAATLQSTFVAGARR